VSRSPDIRVTLGRCDDMRGEVFVRQEGEGHETAAPDGTITGPRRGRDVTLPTTTRLVPLPPVPGSTAVSRAVITEPAFWTPDLPNLYRVEVSPRAAAPHVDAAVTAWIGLRRLGVRGRSFWLDGRRWVPRAIAADIAPARAREAGVGLIVESPAEDLLATTDETGVAVVAVLRGAEVSPERVARLARHPSAMLAIMMPRPTDEGTLTGIRRLAGTLQLGLAADGTLPPPQEPEGVDFLAVTLPEGGVPHAGWTSRPSRPLVAWRRGGAGGRRDCDLLQRDLADWGIGTPRGEPVWDWAGYLVGGGDGRDRLGA
jgi:hypothetical protein